MPGSQAQEIDGVTQFLLERTSPDEAVFTFPEHGLFNFLADRPGPSKFGIAGLAWTTMEWRQGLLDDLRMHPPRFVVRGGSLSNLARSIGRREELLPEVRAYLNERYRVLRRFGTIDVLERLEDVDVAGRAL